LGTRDPYLILQVHPSAVPEVVEAAYRALALLHHPDRNADPRAAAVMADLNWAYQTLRDPASRAAYDRARVPIAIERPSPSLMERMRSSASSERDPDSPSATVVDFGRYAGMTLGQLARSDPAYLEWLRRHTSGLRFRQQIDEVLGSASAHE
jgi:curved DNA-binding protein CbpA